MEGIAKIYGPIVKIHTSLLAARRVVEAGRPLESTEILVKCIDDLLHKLKFREVCLMLEYVDTDYFPPYVLTGVLTATKGRPSVERSYFLSRVEKSLLAKWGHSPDQVTETVERLR